MRITKQDKKDLAKKLGDEFKAKDVVFADFHGLKFKEIDSLRQDLKNAKSRFAVTRNTIVRHALENADLKAENEKLVKGPTAVITLEDPEEISRVAKTLFKFAKEKPSLKVKGGFSAREWLSPKDLETLSKIGSKTELLTQLASMLYSNLAQVRFVLEAPVRDLNLVLDALKDKKGQENK